MAKDALSVTFCGVTFSNPIVLPSGIAQQIPKDHEVMIKAGVGGITTKSLTPKPREGNPIPRVVKYEHGFLNSVGLKGPGMVKGKELIADFLKTSPVPVIVSVFATSIKDFEKFAREFAPLNPPLFELNLSCPNVEDDMGKALGVGCASASAAVKAVKKIMPKTPVLAKLTPNVPNIADVAKGCEQAGADGIVAVNTYSPGMLIDIRTKKPMLGAKSGGLSGPAVFPLALNAIYNIYDAVKIPIIGMGGVTTWQDTVQMMMAGASLVGVGSAIYFKGFGVFDEIKTGLREYMAKDNIKDLKEIVGAAH